MTDGMGWVFAANYREHKWEEDAMTETSAATFNYGIVPEQRWCGVDHPHGAHRFVPQLTGMFADCPGSTGFAARLAVIAEVVAELENSGQMAAGAFVARLAENTQR